jgi:SOS-response transcriptional repressor LexA
MLKKNPLTPIQKKYYGAILELLKENGVFPTYKEIQEHLKMSSVGPIQSAMKQLVKKSWIEAINEDTCARRYRLVPSVHLVYVDQAGRKLPPGSIEIRTNTADEQGQPIGIWIPAASVSGGWWE